MRDLPGDTHGVLPVLATLRRLIFWRGRRCPGALTALQPRCFAGIGPVRIKTPVLTLYPPISRGARLPGSGAASLHYASFGSREKGHSGAGFKDRLPRVPARPGRRTGRSLGPPRRRRQDRADRDQRDADAGTHHPPPGRRRPATLGPGGRVHRFAEPDRHQGAAQPAARPGTIDAVLLITVSSGTGPNAKTPGRALPRHIRGQQPGSGAVSPAYAPPGPVNTAASNPGSIFPQPGWLLPARRMRMPQADSAIGHQSQLGVLSRYRSGYLAAAPLEI
jgi:hypothetical protein